MDQIFVLQNQDKRFLSKHNEWVDGRDTTDLFKSRHKDEALNQMVEVNAKDVDQRIRIIGCPAQANGQPQIDPDQLPPRQPEPEPAMEAAEPADPTQGNPASPVAVNEP